MKTTLQFLLLIAIACIAPIAGAAGRKAADNPDRLQEALRAADDERIAATMAGDRARLAAVYSDELHYSHSNGRADTKASQIEGLVNGTNRWVNFEYKERTFTPVAPGIALMKGRVVANMVNKTSGQKGVLDLVFLAVWREENGKWRFLAWQSCRFPAADAKK